MEWISQCLWVFLLSMTPVLELRAAIPLGAGLGLPLWLNYTVCVLGNFLPVPFILLFIRRILAWMKTTKHLSRLALWLEEKAQRGGEKVMRYASLGLVLFVAVPLPGTGAWTGALVAALLDMRMKYALPAIFAGVAIAGCIMSLASYGVVNLFRVFL